MAKFILNSCVTNEGINLENAQVVTRVTSGYTWGNDYNIPINGILIAVGFDRYLTYSFENGIAYLKDGSTKVLKIGNNYLKDVVKITFRIQSNNASNGAGIACITYISD